MIDIRNHALDRLRAGELSLGVGLRQARTVDIAKAMKTAGFDWLFIDMEHNAMDVDMAVQICVAAQDAGITPIVRVPGFQHFHATRVLDGGAQGIVVPHVDDAETAAQMVSNVRYPPLGHRSVTAIANADAIAAVPGVDALLIGTSDLTMEMGIPGQFDHQDVIAAYETVIAACRKHGKHPGMGGVYDPANMQRYISIGARLILSGSDFSFLMAGARAQASAVRAMSPS